ncbi:hypothetical protein CJ263_08605 [Maribacter cobaltidurans]|uniref:Uncharacterized protein n=1 Tax=Maribacter cobaltidurans TaxID=1178778 RepID=A0A223V4N4_9FLAO|nr:hypothetical protein CJ263_08605 [Maribacter cobaltidurans]
MRKFLKSYPFLTTKKLPSLVREGCFTLVKWGGSEFDTFSITEKRFQNVKVGILDFSRSTLFRFEMTFGSL